MTPQTARPPRGSWRFALFGASGGFCFFFLFFGALTVASFAFLATFGALAVAGASCSSAGAARRALSSHCPTKRRPIVNTIQKATGAIACCQAMGAT